MKSLQQKLIHLFIIGIFVTLYFLVATISMINSVAFFDLTHDGLMNWALAIGFELGAAASLAAIIILEKTNKTMVWSLFILLTTFQMMANSYHAYANLEDYQGWMELFGLQDEETIFQKRILSIVSGAILPIVSLGFIKSLTDYLRPSDLSKKPKTKHNIVEEWLPSEIVDKYNSKSQNPKVLEGEGVVEEKPEIVPEVKPEPKRRGRKPKPKENNPEKSELTEPKKRGRKPKNQKDELEVSIDEKTGTTFVKSRNKMNPL